MPLLDAALAFALTMLGLSSLIGFFQELIHGWSRVRTRQLEKMIERFFAEHLIPVAEERLAAASEVPKEQKDAFAQRLTSLSEATRSPQGDKAQLRPWLSLFGVQDLLDQTRTHELEHIADEHLMALVEKSEAIQHWTARLGQDPNVVLAELRRGWQSLGAEFTERFRINAKVSATWLAVALAFGLNIDSLHLLEVYMHDDSSREAVIARQGLVADSPSSDPSPSDGRPTEASAPSMAQLQQQVAAFRGSAFPIGWNLYPSCPPLSTDSRCAAYWLATTRSFDLDSLSFEQRSSLNPTSHPLRALGFGTQVSGSPISTLVHTSTDGGPATDGGPTGDPSQVPLQGSLPIWTLISWMLGCLLTGVLAGRGSPFWIEVVRRMAVTRDRLRQQRRQVDASQSPKPEIAAK